MHATAPKEQPRPQGRQKSHKGQQIERLLAENAALRRENRNLRRQRARAAQHIVEQWRFEARSSAGQLDSDTRQVQLLELQRERAEILVAALGPDTYSHLSQEIKDLINGQGGKPWSR